ncbi:hypothetical protein GURASL_15810 [Geotalea uraniireducens]|uniref:Uncharacterized protein n=1 Tax=Geotalea uraniireducens TaxID=351604 RepID=A0ABN6VQT0_9BACT|nr:hypothetical protein GURASL_15810 [Geotalea uraniireducens]
MPDGWIITSKNFADEGAFRVAGKLVAPFTVCMRFAELVIGNEMLLLIPLLVPNRERAV